MPYATLDTPAAVKAIQFKDGGLRAVSPKQQDTIKHENDVRKMLTNLQSINVLTGGIKCTHVACARKTGGTHNEVADSSKCLNHLFRILTDTKACELHQYVTFLQSNRTSVHLTAKLETYRSCSTKITSGAESSA